MQSGGVRRVVAVAAPAAAKVPPGFTDQLVTPVPRPTSVSFTPDGRGVITTQTGTVRILTRGSTLAATPALDLGARACTNNERGALGSAVDPAFASNRFVYVYWTFAKFGGCDVSTAQAPVNRVARYVLGDNNIIDPASEVVLLDNIPSPTGFHNSGDLEFGKDGFLYVTVGDGGLSSKARRMDLYAGKVLRITRDGAPAPGNPFLGAGSDPCGRDGTNAGGQTCQEIYATGLRNPFRMAHNPNTPPGVVQAYVNDVGQNDYEEVNLLAAGADYGWNLREGRCVWGSPDNCSPPPAGLTNPTHSYRHTQTPCNAITGGAFVPNGAWAPQFDNDYLFADYVCGRILRLEPNGFGGFTKTALVTDLGQGSAVHLQFGPYQGGTALYYTVFGAQGQLRRLTFTSGDVQPTAGLTATPTSGAAPLAVTLDGSASFDPEGGPLTYLWDLGDGTTAQTTSPTSSITHTYAAGSYTASLRVRDSSGQISSPATALVSAGNSPPVATISTPSSGSTWRVNERVTLTGTAVDPEQGTLPASALTWTGLLHHNDDHVHPLLLESGNGLSFSFPAPEDFQATAHSYVEVVLEATDAGGLTGVATRDIQPRRVTVTLASDVPGRHVRAHGEGPFTTPTTLISWVGWRFILNALPAQNGASSASWSDGGAARHSVAPTEDVTYTATYTP